MELRTMYDSVNVSALPIDGDLYAGYVDGLYKNVTEIAARFPHKRIVKITVTGKTTNAHVADVETGDLTPAQGADWAKRRIAGGYKPTLYCNTSTRPAVEAACKKLGLTLNRDYWIWEAHYDGDPTLPVGAVAKQYLGDFHGYDKSSVADYWPGVDAPPASPLPTWYCRVLKFGMRGDDIVFLKRRLRALGYQHLALSGASRVVFGLGTYRAVQAFQRKERLKVTGVVDDATARKLRRP